MARTVKAAEERRREILNIAQEFFLFEGYHKTSINQIIEQVQISKGAFYHHFASKDALLEALVERMVTESLERSKLVLEGNDNAIDKLNAFYAAGRATKREQIAAVKILLGALYRQDNLPLRHKLQARTVELTAPFLAEIIREGHREGVFKVEHPNETAEILLHLGSLLQDTIATHLSGPLEDLDDAIEALERKLHLLENIMERSLGAPEGSLTLVEENFVKALLSS